MNSETLGDRIRHVRGGLSQVEFATRLDADKNTVGRYERGERHPDSEFLSRIRMVFAVSIDWLLTGDGPMLLADRAADASGPPDVPPAAGTSTADAAAGLDEDLMGRVVEGIMGVYTEMGARIGPRDVGRMATRVYTDVLAASDGPEDHTGALKMALRQLRKDIATPGEASSSKRLA